MDKKLRLPDHGTITIHGPQDDMMLLHLSEQARTNSKKPGQASGRMEATRTRDGRTEKGLKVLHLDQNAQRLTITETWGGVETARETRRLDGLEAARAPASAGPTPPPDPGPGTPAFVRLPFHAADLLPEDDLRDWATERAQEDVFNLSVLPRRIRLFGKGFQEIVALPQALAANVAPGTGATLVALRARRGVERCLVEGWLGSVDARGTAWIFEPDEGGAWWLAMRTFERRPGMLGVWTSVWSRRSGLGPGALPSSLRAVLDPPAGEPAIPVGNPQDPEPPDLGMFGGVLPPEEPVPATAQAVADRVGRNWEAGLPLGKTPDGARVTVFRGREWETWVLRGEFPMGVDDLIRAIAARGEPPTSIAMVRMGILPMEGEVYRALLTVGEADGRRWTRALLIGLAPDGTVLGHRLAARDHGVIEDDGWIGVAPVTEMSLFTLGAGEA